MGFSLKKLIRGAGDFIGLDGQLGYQGQQPQQPKPPAPASIARPQQPSTSQKVAKFLGGIPNIKLDGLAGLRDMWNGDTMDPEVAKQLGQTSGIAGQRPITVGAVGRNVPILKQGIQFADAQAKNPNQSLLQGEKELFFGGKDSTGAAQTGAHYAPYAVPEVDLVSPGTSAVTRMLAKGANNFLPGALASGLDQLAEGEHDGGKILKNAAVAGAGNAALATLPIVRDVLGKGRSEVDNVVDKVAGNVAIKAPEVVTPKPTVATTSLARPKAIAQDAPRPTTKLVPDRPVVEPTVATPTLERPVAPHPITNPADTELVQNRFTTGVQNSPEVSPEVQGMVSGQHAPRNTQELVGRVQQQIQDEGLEPALSRTLHEMSVPSGQTSDETLARAIELAKHYDSIGDEASQNLAASLYDQVSEHGVGKGQGSQILSMLARRSPAGLRNKALRDLKKAGVEITPAIQKEVQGHIDLIRGMEDGPAKDFAVAAFQKAVLKHVPQKTADNAMSVWKAGLLSGTKTQGGNLLSNSTFAGLRKISDIPATLADKIISMGTKERTKTLTMKGEAAGVKEGFRGAKTTLKTGIDTRNIGDKYEQHADINFKNKIVQKVLGDPANFVFRGMNAADQPFYYPALKNSLYDQAKAKGLTAGLKGDALKKYMEDLVQDPTEKMVVTATKEAGEAVLGFDTLGSKAIQGLHKGIDNLEGVSPAGKSVAKAFVNVLAPFVRVPSAFLSRTVDFTPLGIGKEVFSQVAKKNFDQRALSQAIGEGATGAGIIGLGIALAHNSMLSGDFPSDPKERERWKAEGIQPNSIKLGDKWISLNYMGPLGLLFNAGNKMAGADKEGAGGTGQAAAALAGLGQGLIGQSFLQGFSGFSDAIKDPERNAMAFVRSEVGSLIPSWSNDLANATDSKQRQTNSALDAAATRIPGLRQTLNAKQDAFGNDLNQPDGGLNAATNPLKPSKDLSNDLTKEIDRLKGSGKENFVMPVPDKTITVGKENIKLDGDQQYAYNTARGQEIQRVWNDIIKSPDYAALNDTDKASALRKGMEDVSAVAKTQMLQALGHDDASKIASDGLSNNQYRILTGGQVDLADYTKDKTTTGGDIASGSTSRNTNPKKTYENALADYNRDKAKLSPEDRYKRGKTLRDQSVKKDYSQEVIDMYGMSKADLQSFLSANPDKKSLVGQVLDLDKKLAGAKGAKTKFGGTVATKGKKGKGKSSLAAMSSARTKEAATSSALRNIVKRHTIKRKAITIKKRKVAKT